MKKTLSLFLFSFTIMLAPRANAQDLIDGGNPSEVLAFAKKFGEANLTTDDTGAPAIAGYIGDLFYVFLFYGCLEGRSCTEVQLGSYIEFEEPPSLSRVNAWNRDRRIGSLAVDREGDLIFTDLMNVEEGVTRSALNNFFRDFVVHFEAIEQEFSAGTPARSNVEPLDDEDTSAEQYSDNINSELDSFTEEEVAELVETFGIEALLSAFAKGGMMGSPDGVRLTKFVVIEEVKAVGESLYFDFLIDPEAKAYFDAESFSTSTVSTLCASRLMRHLFKEGAEVNLIYTYEGESENFGKIVLDFKSCRESVDG